MYAYEATYRLFTIEDLFYTSGHNIPNEDIKELVSV